MKKILIATTALVATAGVAAADVSFSGYGRFGLMENFAGTSGIYTRLRLQIDMTTEADNGLTFGARVRHQVTTFNSPPAGGWGFNGARFYVSTGGLTVAAGNILGAIEAMPGIYMPTQSGSIGLSGLGFHSLVTNTNGAGYWNWDAYSSAGAGRNGVEVMYNSGDFAGHLSYSSNGAVDRTAINVSYAFNDWKVALGYQDSTVASEEKLVLTVGGKLGNAGINFGVADNNGTTKFALNGSYEVGAATTLTGFLASEDGIGGGESYGLGVSHSLGGGASIEGGVVRDTASNTAFDLGLKFNF